MREDFTPSERVVLAEDRAEYERRAARKRQGTRIDLGHSVESTGSVEGGDARQRIARRVGLSGKTWERAREMVEAAKGRLGPPDADSHGGNWCM